VITPVYFRTFFSSSVGVTNTTGLEIVAKHEGRHLLQAEGVRQSASFPQ
jgi:hypothetical protein